MKIKLIFTWYNFCVVAFWYRSKQRLCLFPVPMLGVVIQFQTRDTCLVDEGGDHPITDFDGSDYF